MVLINNKTLARFNRIKKGRGILNNAISNLPVELHLMDGLHRKYNFCGPGTKIEKRIIWENGIPVKVLTPPINELDNGCMYHDIAYTQYDDVYNRNIADRQLKNVADEFYQNSSTAKDKWNALIVDKIMGIKIKNKI